MNQKYFDSLGHIKCAIKNSELLRLKGLKFRIEGEPISEKDARLEVTLIITPDKRGESTRKFETLLVHYWEGNCCDRGMSPSPNNPKLVPFAKASGLSDKQLLARIIGNSLVRYGAKLEVAYRDKGDGELEFLLVFPPGYSDCVRFPISQLPDGSVFYDRKEAERQFLRFSENSFISLPVRGEE